MKKNYRVALAGWIDGKLRSKDEQVPLTDKQAKYLLASGQVEVLRAVAAAIPPRRKPAPKPMEAKD